MWTDKCAMPRCQWLVARRDRRWSRRLRSGGGMAHEDTGREKGDVQKGKGRRSWNTYFIGQSPPTLIYGLLGYLPARALALRVRLYLSLPVPVRPPSSPPPSQEWLTLAKRHGKICAFTNERRRSLRYMTQITSSINRSRHSRPLTWEPSVVADDSNVCND